MPLILDPDSFPISVLAELRQSLRSDLEETREIVVHPKGQVMDPTGIENARDLLDATLAVLDRPRPDTARALAADMNLAYATMVAVIDLVKSHSAGPKVPRRRPG